VTRTCVCMYVCVKERGEGKGGVILHLYMTCASTAYENMLNKGHTHQQNPRSKN